MPGPSGNPASLVATRRVVVTNQRGLHARAAARFVRLAAGYDAGVTVARDDLAVSADSIMGLMMLAAGPGSELVLTAEGPQADSALEALVQLVEHRFEEES